MSSERKPSSTALVLGILGSIGGFLSSATWAVLFLFSSPSFHGENAPLYTQEQVLILIALVASSTLGVAGAVMSRRYPRTGGIVMLAASSAAITTMTSIFSGSGLFLLSFPTQGWWTVVLLVGGLFATLTKVQKKSESGTPAEKAPPKN